MVFQDLIQALTPRYHQIPTFGNHIRRFSQNVSEMKKMTAHNLENVLQVNSLHLTRYWTNTALLIIQCSMPAFEGMFPNKTHDNSIQKLLYVCCEWHALAKLRLHMDETLALLEKVTTILGTQLRKFAKDLCPAYSTTETDREVTSRKRRAQRKTIEQGRPLQVEENGKITATNIFLCELITSM
jgi:hypothetical protein